MRCDLHAVFYVYESSSSNCSKRGPICMKFSTHIMTSELTSTVYSLTSSLQSYVSVSVCAPPILSKQRLGDVRPSRSC
jgi:hypothetical protein